MCYIILMFLFSHCISYLMDVLYWNTRINTNYCSSKKKKNLSSFFGFGIFCPEVSSGLLTKMAKKNFGRFFGHPGHIFGQILGFQAWSRMSFWLKCSPSIAADWSLKVANVSPHRKIFPSQKSKLGQNRPKYVICEFCTHARQFDQYRNHIFFF